MNWANPKFDIILASCSHDRLSILFCSNYFFIVNFFLQKGYRLEGSEWQMAEVLRIQSARGECQFHQLGASSIWTHVCLFVFLFFVLFVHFLNCWFCFRRLNRLCHFRDSVDGRCVEADQNRQGIFFVLTIFAFILFLLFLGTRRGWFILFSTLSFLFFFLLSAHCKLSI